MGTKGRTSKDNGLEARVALLEDALHQTRQRADLLVHAVEELARLHAGRGLDRDELIESLSLHGAPVAATIVMGAGLLEPDHPESHEPRVLPWRLVCDLGAATTTLTARARLAGARLAFTGEDALADLREVNA